MQFDTSYYILITSWLHLNNIFITSNYILDSSPPTSISTLPKRLLRLYWLAHKAARLLLKNLLSLSKGVFHGVARGSESRWSAGRAPRERNGAWRQAHTPANLCGNEGKLRKCDYMRGNGSPKNHQLIIGASLLCWPIWWSVMSWEYVDAWIELIFSVHLLLCYLMDTAFKAKHRRLSNTCIWTYLN